VLAPAFAAGFALHHAVDLILAILALEVAGLILYRHLCRRGPAPADLMATVLAGACLLFALRAALVGAPPAWIGVWLTGALFAHLVDLRRRWPRR
jgi:hypothetical protein